MLELFDPFMGDLSSISPGLFLAFGFAIGLLHAMEGDHMAAVATLVSKNRKLSKASLLGAFWGLGHILTLFGAGLAVLLLAINIPEKLALGLEFGVGIMLIVLGLSVIRTVKSNRFIDSFFAVFSRKHVHPHEHGDKIHVHQHSHDREHSHSHKSIIIGMVHGLAGSGALMLVVLSTVDSVMDGLVYIVLFGIGSIVGMLAISTAIGLPFVLTAGKFANLNRYIRAGAATVSILLGLSIMYEVGLVEELFVL